jgi:hypothetical protein
LIDPRRADVIGLKENMVIQRFALLYAHERNDLLGALRRDLRAAQQLSEIYPQHADYHLLNYRRTLRLLEVLNPRKPRAAAGLGSL